MTDEQRTTEPHDRLTRLCAAMTEALDAHPERGDEKCIVFLQSDTDKRGGLQLHGYDDDTDALVDLFLHLRAIFRSNGRSSSSPAWATRSAMADRPRKNAYWCETCRGYVITIDVDEGVTPMFLACRVKGDPTDPANDCKGMSRSMMYPEEPWPETDGYGDPIPTEPTWEWYRPAVAELDGLSTGMREHIEKGGLALRPKAGAS